MKTLLDRTIEKLDHIKKDIIATMEEMDSRNWHHEVKYANADLNALFVLITSSESYAKELHQIHADLIENRDHPTSSGEE